MGVNTARPNLEEVLPAGGSTPYAKSQPKSARLIVMGWQVLLLSLLLLGMVGADFQPFFYHKFPAPVRPKLFHELNLKPGIRESLSIPIYKDTFKPESSAVTADTFLPSSNHYEDTFLSVDIASKERELRFGKKRDFEKLDMGRKDWFGTNLSITMVP